MDKPTTITDEQAKIIGREIGQALAAALTDVLRPPGRMGLLERISAEMQSGARRIAEAVKQ
jgi:hypothetical protein